MPKSARAVANACGKNPYAPRVPCNRVIRSDGSLGGFSAPGGVKAKKKMLKKEDNINNENTISFKLELIIFDKLFTGKKPPEEIKVIDKLEFDQSLICMVHQKPVTLSAISAENIFVTY